MVNFSELIKYKNNLNQINSPKAINQLIYSTCRTYVVYKKGKPSYRRFPLSVIISPCIKLPAWILFEILIQQ